MQRLQDSTRNRQMSTCMAGAGRMLELWMRMWAAKQVWCSWLQRHRPDTSAPGCGGQGWTAASVSLQPWWPSWVLSVHRHIALRCHGARVCSNTCCQADARARQARLLPRADLRCTALHTTTSYVKRLAGWSCAAGGTLSCRSSARSPGCASKCALSRSEFSSSSRSSFARA